jgi:hypothetical protein
LTSYYQNYYDAKKGLDFEAFSFWKYFISLQTKHNEKFLILLLILFFIPVQSQTWVNLFDGKTLKGWKQLNGKAKYRVEHGQIIGSTVANTPKFIFNH